MIRNDGGPGAAAVCYLVAAVLAVTPLASIAQKTPAPADSSSTHSTRDQSTGSGQPNSNNPSTSSGQANSAGSGQGQPERQIYIQEYRVEGTHKLSELEVEEAVYPYLGPGRNYRGCGASARFSGKGLPG